MGIANFKQQAQAAVDQIETATIALGIGDDIAGTVIKVGRFVNKYGPSPVITFSPEDVETEVKADIDGAKLPEGMPITIFGLGAVLGKLRYVRPGDQVYVARLEDAEGDNGTYRNYQIAVSRNGRPPVGIDVIADEGEAPATTVAAPAARTRDQVAAEAAETGEEPF